MQYLGQITAIVLTILSLTSCTTRIGGKYEAEAAKAHVLIANSICKTGSNTVVKASIGAGTVISIKRGRAYVLTAFHVIDGRQAVPEGHDRRILVMASEDGPVFQAQIEKELRNGTDAAVVSFRTDEVAPRVRAARISRRNPRRGERILVFGTTSSSIRDYGRRDVRRYCRISDNCRVCDINDRCFLMNELLRSGYSGGGIYNRHGRLIGMAIATFMRSEDEGMGVAIPIGTLRPLIRAFL